MVVKLMGKVKDSFRSLKNSSILKKTLITTCLGAGVAAGSIYADSFNDSFVEVYHVYVDGKHVGTVENKDDVEQFIDQKEKQAENDYENIDLVSEQEVSFISEVAFTPKDELETVTNTLDESLTFNASAVKLQLEDEVIGYVSNLDEANEALNRVVKQYLPNEIDQSFDFLTKDSNEISTASFLNHLPNDVQQESNQDDENEKESIALNDGSIVLDVDLTEDIDFSEEAVSPNKLLSVEQLVKMIERGTKGKTLHTIKESEVLGQVAMNYDLSMEELLDLNPEIDENSVVQVGQELYVEDDKPFINVTYTVEKEEEESIDFKTVTKDTDSLYKGQTEVDQQGQKGKKKVKYKVTTKNNEVINKVKIEEEVVKEPVEKVVLKGTKVVSSRGTGQFSWPAIGGRITSYMGPRWGRQHKGIDIAGVSNRSILAADNGTVIKAGRQGAFGNRVVIDHNNGYRTLYAHLSSINVSVGQTVKSGQKIGVMGSTGRSTGVHLHFEVIKNGRNINPLDFY